MPENAPSKPNLVGDLLKVTGIFKKAEKLYLEEEEKVTKFTLQKDKDARYYETMLKKGTLNDRINSLSLLI